MKINHKIKSNINSFIDTYYKVKDDFSRAIGISVTNRHSLTSRSDNIVVAHDGFLFVVRVLKFIKSDDHNHFFVGNVKSNIKVLNKSELVDILSAITKEIKGRKSNE